MVPHSFGAVVAVSLALTLGACTAPLNRSPRTHPDDMTSETHCAVAHRHERRAVELDREAAVTQRQTRRRELRREAENEREFARQHAEAANRRLDRSDYSRAKPGCATEEVSHPGS